MRQVISLHFVLLWVIWDPALCSFNNFRGWNFAILKCSTLNFFLKKNLISQKSQRLWYPSNLICTCMMFLPGPFLIHFWTGRNRPKPTKLTETKIFIHFQIGLSCNEMDRFLLKLKRFYYVHHCKKTNNSCTL